MSALVISLKNLFHFNKMGINIILNILINNIMLYFIVNYLSI